ncbi:UDP-N-acetylmuramoyl-L-alanine--D-glutamate ligase [Sphingomonas sp.]|uniref:UDP-N-acetylmuramoyl-L-alanine--D-glutamate ligase n=1 Tax=Sphingomonas sp. TaxID=28214 RepID=UPI0017DA7B40|nr:UDP-N-acetylmuramoyl-L-alanine--D-glutamate ligase [Sphingomonas sp.]MBA3510897.1 UDP-N-acetylmuramoyl-L-alanine--D-glutamate ligase [Sphingomonas sp.]
MITARAFAGKHYAVYGLARSGLATAEALLASGAKVTAWDASADARAKAPAGAELADLDAADLSQFDSLVVSPGVPLNRHPIAKRAREAGVEIIGDIELFARARPELPEHKVVGITGTNGKSTTTALVHHILQTAGVPSAMGGNIGLPILAQDPLLEGGVYVLELSSYQLDLTQSLDCDVAVLLNITPDHLDRYDSFEAYAASKLRLFEMQSPECAAVVVAESDLTSSIAEKLGGRAALVRTTGGWTAEGVSIAKAGVIRRQPRLNLDGERLTETNWPALQGPHNMQNAAAAIAAVDAAVGMWPSEAEALRTFPGLPHRMERVAERNGVIFVNDSKATNPTAAAPALAAFPAIRWICGGQAKSDDLDECEPHFGHVRSAYTIGEAAELFERLLKPHMPVKNCRELEVAVKAAADDAQAGDTVLLSPACASFDQFRDFEERGDKFRQVVGAL